IIGVYFLMREFNKDKVFGILGMLFVGLSMGDAARTSATVYRGDGFVTIFVILALLFMIRTFKSVKKNDIYMYAGLTAFLLSLSNIVWNGASFGTAIYVLALVLIMLYAFLTEKLDILDKSRYLMLALLIWYVLVNIYNVLGWIGGQNEAFTGVYFIVLFLMLVAGNELARYLIKNRERFSIYVSTIGRRLMTFAAFTLAAVLFIYFLAPQIVYSIFVASGFQTNIAFAASIEELQAPTAQFLFASFGATLFMAPMNFIMYISTYYPQFVTSFWVLAMALIAMYFFMEFEGVDGSKFLGGRAVVRFKMNEALLVFVAYYAVTAYLQMHAVRFNSLLSIPLAIFTAYTMYWVLLWLKNFNKFSFFLGVILLVAIIGYIMYIDAGYTASLIQADNINPNFISAMGWVHNNTSPNSVFLTLWPDGSVVEGIGNRTSVTDSVGSQNKSKAGPFAAWLFNTTKDGQFLTSSINGRPNYLLVRYTWLLETSGIYTETVFNATSYNQSIITQLARGAFGVNSVAALNPQQLAQLNAAIPQLYAYNVFDSFAEHFNSSTESFTFTNTQQGFQAILVLQNLNNSQAINAYITSTSGGGKSPFKYVVLYNQDNANYQIFQQTAYAQTNNQTMVVQYSSVPKPGAYVNVTAAYMANIGLASSNMFKLIFLCGAQSCSWNNSVAHLQLAYINKDSKIFRIIYNSTAS
ncbi:MAG: hypothetical protein KGH49_02010, partial [Candidatus Micrarchaeota archaeon]|nr:hypothetical protein [Candidatus Micrarchaeota archaeon]